jgi:hypothetical protein
MSEPISLYMLFQLIIVGLCTGIGSAVGNYFAHWAFIRRLEKVGNSQSDAKSRQ